jgi:hypothetical protein
MQAGSVTAMPDAAAGRFECEARKSTLPEPQDCDWPFCGCDPYADKVISSLEESGVLSRRLPEMDRLLRDWAAISKGLGLTERNGNIADFDDELASLIQETARATLRYRDKEPETEANARLISAAPKLLELLKRAQEELRLIRMKDCGAVYDATLRLEMASAIADVEGR